LVFITKARDIINIMVNAKASDFSCPNVKAKAKDSFLEDFSMTSAESLFHHLRRPKIYK